MTTNVRLARADDLEAMRRICNRAIAESIAHFALEPESLADWQEAWRQYGPTYPWLIATDEPGADAAGEVRAFARAMPYQSRGAYGWTTSVAVYVDEAHRRRGYGRALYQRLMPTLTAQGYHSAVAIIALPNPASERLHEECGFQRFGLLPRAGWKFNQWHDVAYWFRHLAPHDVPASPIRLVAEVFAE